MLGNSFLVMRSTFLVTTLLGAALLASAHEADEYQENLTFESDGTKVYFFEDADDFNRHGHFSSEWIPVYNPSVYMVKYNKEHIQLGKENVEVLEYLRGVKYLRNGAELLATEKAFREIEAQMELESRPVHARVMDYFRTWKVLFWLF